MAEQTNVSTKIKQPPMSLTEQKQVYDGELVVNEALALSCEERGGMAAERAVILRLREAGWKPPSSAVEAAARRVVLNAYGTTPKHTRARDGGCRDDCIPCGIEALRVALEP